jgi:hypothetical protein
VTRPQEGQAAGPARGVSMPEAGQAGPAAPDCSGETCITCSDAAVTVTVVCLLGDDLAMVDTGVSEEIVSVALVTAQPGDQILVHAKEAIAVISS